MLVHNLTFHGVGRHPRPLSPDEAKVWVTTETFLATLDAVRKRRDVRISFDDGNRSDVETALPALRDRGLTATFFVLAGRLGDSQHLSADDVRELVRSGMTIGSHGMHHRNWRQLDAREMDEELVTARGILEEAAGRPIGTVSVPFGAYDRTVLKRIRKASGYDRVFTSDGGQALGDAWLQARTSVTAADRPSALATALPLPVLLERSAKRLVKRWR